MAPRDGTVRVGSSPLDLQMHSPLNHSWSALWLGLIGVIILLGLPHPAHAVQPVVFSTSSIRLAVDTANGQQQEVFSIRSKGAWLPVLSASPSIRVHNPTGLEVCAITGAALLPNGMLILGRCGAADFEQRIAAGTEDDVLTVATQLRVKNHARVNSVEDRYDFLPEKNTRIDEYTGPLDFVWSQNLKSEATDLVASNSFKSPVVMMQQKNLFTAIVPALNDHHVEARAMDLDVTSGSRPWMSFGAIPSEPHGHSYFRRAPNTVLSLIDNTVEYEYSLVLSEEVPKLGYRRAVRLLWQMYGHPEMLRSTDEQRKVNQPEIHSFDQWRAVAWQHDADRVYSEWPCGARHCGTLASNRSVNGDWQHWSTDAWFNPWFETLRTAYGWYLHGRASGNSEMRQKAESVLNLALSAPQKDGAFPSIYLVKTKQWIPGDGWAGYQDSYHSFSMSWTAYWMLRWAEDLVPERKPEVLAFARKYGDFLLSHQQLSGVIPSWFTADYLTPRPEFRDFNAETAPSALFLAALASSTGDAKYRTAAERAMAFVMRDVVPRQRWFDYETYLSCSRKPYGFYDAWTAQYPQNNLAEMQAPQAMLALYRATGEQHYLAEGTQLLDYLLLTQQVWNNPQFTPLLVGGFTTQNSDTEWSDARQAYAATLLADYYQATGNMEYLERAVAAARSTFAVAPWENWAHTGYLDEPGALTGFHWGTGSAMTSVEILQPVLGDAFIDGSKSSGVGFDECTIDAVRVEGDTISFQLTSSNLERSFTIHFRGLEPMHTYRVHWSQGGSLQASGETLLKSGLVIPPLHTSTDTH